MLKKLVKPSKKSEKHKMVTLYTSEGANSVCGCKEKCECDSVCGCKDKCGC
jgi:hypothetical protein